MTNPQIGVMLTLETIDPGVARDDRPNSLASSASDPMPTGVAGGCVKPDRGVLVVCAPLAVELHSGGGIAPGDEIAVDIDERVRVASAVSGRSRLRSTRARSSASGSSRSSSRHGW